MRELVAEVVTIFSAGGVVMGALLATSCAIWFLMVWWWWSLHCEWRSVGSLIRAAERVPVRGNGTVLGKYLADRRSVFAAAVRRSYAGEAAQRSRDRLELELESARIRIAGPDAPLGVLVHIAPLLGLLGTVYGMVATFGVLTVTGTSEPQALARGISCALLTTQAGLLVAVPGLYGHEWLRRWDQRMAVEVRRLSSALAPFYRGAVSLRGGQEP